MIAKLTATCALLTFCLGAHASPNPSSQVASSHLALPQVTMPQGDHVVLLHGLARSASSMSKLAEVLEAQGYRVCNVAYPSRNHSIAELASDFVLPALQRCVADPHDKVHFVTHSLGGIIVRQLLSTHAVVNVGRVVMLSPPNHGSEVVDKLGGLSVFDWLNGPAGRELGTQADATPSKLGPADFEVGIITGVSSINPFLSLMIPGKDDGKVAVKNAKLDGMKDFLIVRCSHPLIMKSERVITQTLRFLQQGSFEHIKNSEGEESPGNCWG